MMPSSRAEVYVTYRDQNGNIVTPPAGASATLQNAGADDRPGRRSVAGDPISPPSQFNQSGSQRNHRVLPLTFAARHAVPTSATASLRRELRYAKPAPLPAGCKPLASRSSPPDFLRCRDPTNPDIFGLGYEEVDQNGVVIPSTEVPVTAFDPTANSICIPLGAGQTPVTETWELVNLATENHNFHIHQTRFVQPPGRTLKRSTGSARHRGG